MRETLIATVRHGTTEFNRLKKIAGTTDILLDQNGIKQALEARPFILRERYEVVISSPLRRCVDTAFYCTNLSKNRIIIKKDCMERNYGKMQGLIPIQIKKLKPKILYFKAGKYFHSLNPPDGETFEQVRQRARKFLSYILKKNRGKKILVFSHQTFLQQFHGLINGVDPYNSLAQDIVAMEINYFYFDSQDRLIKYSHKILSTNSYSSW